MAFFNDVIIYQKGEIKIAINQCYNKGKKKNLFAIRRDDKTGMGYILGNIRYSGRWWQYVFQPEKDTQWSSSCMIEIVKFLDKINKVGVRRK